MISLDLGLQFNPQRNRRSVLRVIDREYFQFSFAHFFLPLSFLKKRRKRRRKWEMLIKYSTSLSLKKKQHFIWSCRFSRSSGVNGDIGTLVIFLLLKCFLPSSAAKEHPSLFYFQENVYFFSSVVDRKRLNNISRVKNEKGLSIISHSLVFPVNTHIMCEESYVDKKLMIDFSSTGQMSPLELKSQFVFDRSTSGESMERRSGRVTGFFLSIGKRIAMQSWSFECRVNRPSSPIQHPQVRLVRSRFLSLRDFHPFLDDEPKQVSSDLIEETLFITLCFRSWQFSFDYSYW